MSGKEKALEPIFELKDQGPCLCFVDLSDNLNLALQDSLGSISDTRNIGIANLIRVFINGPTQRNDLF